MKTTAKRFILSLSVLTIVVLLLSACSGSTTPTGGGEPSAPGSSTEAPASATEIPAASTPDCPYGKWKVTNFDTYMQSVTASISSMASDVTVSNTTTTGDAYLTFNEDGSGSFMADNFIVNFTMEISSMALPVVLTQNGTSTAHFTISGDQITLEDQDMGDYTILMDMAGTTSNLDFNVLGNPGEVQLYQFSCPSADTLSLKVIAVDDMDLAPLELIRVP